MKQLIDCASHSWQHKYHGHLLAFGSFLVLIFIAWQVSFSTVIAQEISHSPTFSNEVVRILQENCQQCHQPGGIAPMSLETFEQAKVWAPRIKYNVNRRVMPPWHLDPTIGIQEYKNDYSLSEDNIDTLVAWVDAGAPEGDPANLPPPVSLSLIHI